jgi:hypothetical protein
VWHAWKRREMYAVFWLENPKKESKFEDWGIDERMIYMLRLYDGMT